MSTNDIAALPQDSVEAKSSYASLSQDYNLSFNSFFEFAENPFSNTPDPNFFYMSRQHREVLLSMIFGVQQRRGFIVVTGEIGAGKTTLCRRFLQQLAPEIKTAVILNPKISSTHLLSSVVRDFGIPDCGKTKRGIYEGLSQFLLDGIQHSQNACLIVDEAQSLNLKVLEEIRLLSNLETSKQKLMQIILIGQPELKEILMRGSLKQIRQRLGVHVHLNGLNLEETVHYIQQRLNCAGGGNCRVSFNLDVVHAVHKMSQGIPRLINTICDRVLIAAYARQTYEITLEVAQSAFEELVFICGLDGTQTFKGA